MFSDKTQRDRGDLENSLRGDFACRVLLQRDIARVYEGWMKAVEFADGGVLSIGVGTDYTSHCGHHRLLMIAFAHGQHEPRTLGEHAFNKQGKRLDLQKHVQQSIRFSLMAQRRGTRQI